MVSAITAAFNNRILEKTARSAALLFWHVDRGTCRLCACLLAILLDVRGKFTNFPGSLTLPPFPRLVDGIFAKIIASTDANDRRRIDLE